LDIDDEDKCSSEKTPYVIKVRSFAKPPDSWKDSLPSEKVKQNFTAHTQQVVNEDLVTPTLVDLSTDKYSRLPCTSTQIINPLAINNRRIQINKNVVLKKVISNYKIPLHNSDVKSTKIATFKNVCVVNTKKTEQTITYTQTNILVNNTPASNLNHVPNTLSTNAIVKPCKTVKLQKINTSNDSFLTK
jgi:hypothetical protein